MPKAAGKWLTSHYITSSTPMQTGPLANYFGADNTDCIFSVSHSPQQPAAMYLVALLLHASSVMCYGCPTCFAAWALCACTPMYHGAFKQACRYRCRGTWLLHQHAHSLLEGGDLAVLDMSSGPEVSPEQMLRCTARPVCPPAQCRTPRERACG